MHTRFPFVLVCAAASLALSHVARAQAIHSTFIASGFLNPTQVTSAPGDVGRLFVTEVTGRIRVVRHGQVLPTPFLNVAAGGGGPVLLTSIAFHPFFQQNGRFFVSFYDAHGASSLREFHATPGSDVADATSGFDVISPIDHGGHLTDHPGGQIQFGPDGMLYLSLGDAEVPAGAQSPTTYDGKILRIDVDAAAPHVPTDNPFADPNDGVLDLIWAFGFRNPWRFSFDRLTGEMWITDVGDLTREEIDHQPLSTGMPGDPTYHGGRNYGWPCMEGSLCQSSTACTCGAPQLVAPVFDYPHAPGQSAVIGGYVYRGTRIAGLQGAYFFGDYGTGRVQALRYDGTSVTQFSDRTVDLNPSGAQSTVQIVAFGEDAGGEIYFLMHGGPNQGALYRVDPGGTLCPEPTHECYGSTNSTGHSAIMQGLGTSCLSNDDLTIFVQYCPYPTTGVFIAGTNPAATPFGDGFLCIAPPIFRLGVRNSDAQNSMSYDFHAATAPIAVATGQTWRFQVVYRDQQAGSGHFNASDALEVTFGP